MTASRLKLECLQWLAFQKGCILHATEYRNGSDVFGLNRSNYVIEIEVKCSLSDFMSEMKTVKYLLDPESDSTYGHYTTRFGKTTFMNKFNKHGSYLIDESKYEKRPRYFYFALPYDLVEKAKIEFEKARQLAYLPFNYGLLSVREVNDDFGLRFYVNEEIKAIPMKSEKFTDFYNFALKVANENLNLRSKIGA